MVVLGDGTRLGTRGGTWGGTRCGTWGASWGWVVQGKELGGPQVVSKWSLSSLHVVSK